MKNEINVDGVIEKNEKKIKKTKNGNQYCTFILRHPRKTHANNYFRCHVFQNDLIQMIMKLDTGTPVSIGGELSDYKSAANISRTVIVVKKIEVI